MTDRVIRVVLDSTGVERGATRSGRSLAGVQRRTALLERGFRSLRNAAAGFIAALGARELIRTADTFNRIENRLRIVTDSTDELTEANERLFDIAQDTRQPLEDTVELFTRASIAADELGASEAELFRLTEITGKALAVQGGSAAEASGALRQLSQSFASGIVRAEEFNSILEGAFPLAQAAARGIDEAGGSVGRLRQLVVEGEISSREFFEAILEGGDALDEAFSQTVPTVGQAVTTVSNSFTQLIGQLDEAGGFTTTLSALMIELATDMGTFGSAVTGTLEPTEELSDNLKTLSILAVVAGETFQTLIDIGAFIPAIFDDVGRSVGGAAAGIAAILRGEFKEGLDILNEKGALASTQQAFFNLFEGVDTGVESATERINEILLPALREIREESESLADAPPVEPIPTNVADDVNEAREAIAEFRAELTQSETELRLTALAGEDADEAIRQYREALELAAAESEIFAELLPTPEVEELRQTFLQFATESIAAQRALREEIEAAELAATFDEQIEALQEEIALLGADTAALAANAEARALAEGATADQAERIGELTETLLTERAALEEQTDALAGFFTDVGESAQQQLSGFLADPLSEGLDDLPFKFSQTLQALAGQALASEFFKLITGLLGGPGGGQGGGGFAGLLSGIFGGGLQAGGPISSGGPRLVGERGPELFEPPGSGAIVPNVNVTTMPAAPANVNVINVTDPADVAAGIGSAEGEQEVINVIQRNTGAIRRLLG